ncbi:MAG: ribosome silencing factor [Aquificae bacterium]|nr:ribosome silencing factor [Aquificota bacterium]
MEKLKLIKELLENKKAEDIVILDVSDLTNLADYFIIASANSPTHARALADYLEEELKKRGYTPDHVEGKEHGEWILLDLIDTIVHIFTPETREYYGLEWIWSDAQRVEP